MPNDNPATETQPVTMEALMSELRSRRPTLGAAPDRWTPGETGTRYVQAPRRRGAASYNAREHTVEAVMATGYRVRRWYGFEELAIRDDAINLERVALGQVRLIDHHNTYSRDAVLGTIISARVEDGQLVGVIRFNDSEQGRAAEKDYASGDMTGFSVGYRVNKLVLTETGDEDDVYRAEKWELLELSSVSVPADPHAAVRSATPNPSTSPSTTESSMPNENRTEPNPNPAPPVASPPAATVVPPVASPPAATPTRTEPTGAEVLRAERERIAELQRIATRANIDAAVLQTAITDGTEATAFLRTALDTMAERTQANVGGNTTVQVTRDEDETKRENMTTAIASLLAIRGSDPRHVMPENARAYANYSLIEFAAECIGYRGAIRTAAQVAQVFERAFSQRAGGMLTTSDFPALLMDAMNRRLLSRYQAATPTYRRFCAQYNAVDFRAMNILRAGDFPSLQPVNETGEIKAGAFSESKETMRVYPYGVILNFSRQTLVNDNLGAIDQVLGSAGIRVTDWENVKAFDLLNSNTLAGPTLATDAKAVFHADHNNLFTTTGAGAISVTTVGGARAAMMGQETLDGIKANFIPEILLCGPTSLTAAEQLLATLVPAQQSNAVPESLRRLSPIGDANVTEPNWYLFASPAVAPCFVYGYLEGQAGPRMSSEQPFTQQGLSVKLEHDFGVAGIDYRGAVRNDGSGS